MVHLSGSGAERVRGVSEEESTASRVDHEATREACPICGYGTFSCGLEQAEMAELLGVHRTVVSGDERGVSEPTLSRLVKWADACDVSLDWLCARRDSNPQPFDP